MSEFSNETSGNYDDGLDIGRMGEMTDLVAKAILDGAIRDELDLSQTPLTATSTPEHFEERRQHLLMDPGAAARDHWDEVLLITRYNDGLQP